MNFRKRIAIDLGTTSVLVYSRSKGVILNEPSVVAVDRFTDRVIAVGEEAKKMLGRTPGNIVAERPLKDGVISNYHYTEQMLKYFIKATVGSRLFKPDLIICVPSGANQVQKRAVKQAGLKSGANDVFLIEEPLAAAIGSGIDISENSGHMIIDIGGGTTDIAVIAKGGIVVADSIKIAGDETDRAIIEYVRQNFNVIIGEKMAEDIKLSIGTLDAVQEEFEAKGRNLYTGLPETIILTQEDISKALEKIIEEIANAAKRVISKTPPELVADLYENGAMLTGGGALIRDMKDTIQDIIKINVFIPQNPISSVVIGTGRSLNWISKIDSFESNRLEMTRKYVEQRENLRRR